MLEIGNNIGDTNYKVAQDVCLEGVHYIFGVDEKVKESYCICNMITDGLFKRYDDCIAGGDYLAVLNEWNFRIANAISELQEMQRDIKDFAVCDKSFVEPINCSTSINKKVIVIKPNVLYPESRFSQKQLQFVVGGFGAEGNSRGNAVMCINIDNNKAERFDRSDVLGILRDDKIPSWAKDKIRDLQKNIAEPIVASAGINYIRK
ncbi:MAG: hypothetical protein Q4A46_09205 [Clostridia bacterium]|nr:hypothetical protein [Clostridia bacterium]